MSHTNNKNKKIKKSKDKSYKRLLKPLCTSLFGICFLWKHIISIQVSHKYQSVKKHGKQKQLRINGQNIKIWPNNITLHTDKDLKPKNVKGKMFTY